MLRLAIATLVFALTLPLLAEETSSENLFQKGLAAYQNKQFAEARDFFLEAYKQGVVSAELLHNIALADYQLGEKPRALALWRKALTVDASFRPARLGRDFAENELQQRGWENNSLSQSIYRVLEFISFFESLWLIALVLATSGWLWIRYLAERGAALEEERPLPKFPATAMILSGILVLSFVLFYMKSRTTFMARATVVVNNASARSLPSDDGVGLFDLRGGSEVIVRRHNDDWTQVQNSEGNSGWLKNSEIFITSGR